MYQIELSDRNTPPVALNVPSRESATFFCFFNKSSHIVFTDGDVLMMSISSTNVNPVITKASGDKQNKVFKPKPSSCIMVSKIALIVTHMVDPAPLPCSLP